MWHKLGNILSTLMHRNSEQNELETPTLKDLNETQGRDIFW